MTNGELKIQRAKAVFYLTPCPPLHENVRGPLSTDHRKIAADGGLGEE
jgi:hypothetical protein